MKKKPVLIVFPPRFKLYPRRAETFETRPRRRNGEAWKEAIQIWPHSWTTHEALRSVNASPRYGPDVLNSYWAAAQKARARSKSDTFVMGEASTPRKTVQVAAGESEDRDVDYSQLWALSMKRYAMVQEEYGAIICDPLNALTHAALFSLDVDHIERFTLAMGEVQDLVSIYPVQPSDAVVERLATLTRKLERAWTIALDYSTLKSYSWLPPQELEWAKRAEACLKLAQDENASFAERASAAHHAAKLFGRIETVLFPAKLMGELERSALGELENTPS